MSDARVEAVCAGFCCKPCSRSFGAFFCFQIRSVLISSGFMWTETDAERPSIKKKRRSEKSNGIFLMLGGKFSAVVDEMDVRTEPSGKSSLRV